MVAHVLGGHDDLVDKPDRADEVLVLEGLGDRVAVPAPAVEAPERLLDLVVAEQCHTFLS
jgi:hypothetical protein